MTKNGAWEWSFAVSACPGSQSSLAAATKSGFPVPPAKGRRRLSPVRTALPPSGAESRGCPPPLPASGPAGWTRRAWPWPCSPTGNGAPGTPEKNRHRRPEAPPARAGPPHCAGTLPLRSVPTRTGHRFPATRPPPRYRTGFAALLCRKRPPPARKWYSCTGCWRQTPG